MKPPHSPTRGYVVIGLAAGLFFLIVGAKWMTFDRFGSPMPDWDQWDAEAAELFIPWFERDHFLAHLFHPHNEHRIILTKLQNLALGLLNGQWDSRLEAVTNAMLHAALGVAFWVQARRWTAARWHAALFLIAAGLFGLPLAWQNVLAGFHSQQYWLLALSFGALVTLPLIRTGVAAWWMGVACAMLALGSMGSGFLAAAAVAPVLAIRILRRETTWRATAGTWLLIGLLVLIGLATRVAVPGHEPLKATSVRDFYLSLVHSLQWPWREADWAAIVMWAPWAWVVLRVGRMQVSGRADDQHGESAAPAELRGGWGIIALGGWVILQLLATAYARGVGGDYPASRYMDTLTFGAMANAIALAWLLSPRQQSRRCHAMLAALAAAWVGTLGVGAGELASVAWHGHMADAKKYYTAAESHLRRYLATQNPDELAFPDIPYPTMEGLTERLAVPSLRALMPVPIRTPLAIASGQPEPVDHDAAFLKNDIPIWEDPWPLQHGLTFDTPPLDAMPTWGSFTRQGFAATGEWRSAPIEPPRFGWLKFETAGHIGQPGVALELQDARTNAVLATVQPSKVPLNSWRAAYVKTPRVPFVIVARDHDPTRWIAFSPPVEMGRLSYGAWQATKHGGLVLIIAAAGSLALWVVWWHQRRLPPGLGATEASR